MPLPVTMLKPELPDSAAFVACVAALSAPNGDTTSLVQALQPSLEAEAYLRTLFATQRTDPRLTDPFLGLVDVFSLAPGSESVRVTRARAVKDDADLARRYVMPLKDSARRQDGTPAVTPTLNDFQKSFAIFSEGSLSLLGTAGWENMVVAGGSVLACLLPLPERVSSQKSKRAVRKWFHEEAYSASDVDIFLYGLTPEQAEQKCIQIYNAVRDSVPWDTTCVRTKHAVSIHSQYPYRSIQIVLRLYASPAEILAGFDVDCACVAYDGQRVWASPRAMVAFMRQCNSVDMSRRSPSYEVRLVKYNARGFEIAVPDLRRDEIDPSIFERALTSINGLARLLVLERISSSDERLAFLSARRELRARPPAPGSRSSRRARQYRGDMKGNSAGLDVSGYENTMFHVPYGAPFDARRVEKIIWQNDLGLNSTFNPKNKTRTLHRHPAFFGTMEECLEDCCQYCPEPGTEEDRILQAAEDEQFVRGRVTFMDVDPGRQSITGSFRPIDEGDWAEQAYIGRTERFFCAIASHDRALVAALIKGDAETPGIDLTRRDHVGRTPLHVAIMVHATDICADLVAAGVRITARLVDGRTPLHLAAQMGLGEVVKVLLERSAANVAEEGRKVQEQQEKQRAAAMQTDEVDEEQESDEERPSSEDDWSSEDSGAGTALGKKGPKMAPAAPPADTDIPEDEAGLPDVIDVNVADWDNQFTPLAYAVSSGSLGMVELLLTAGADPKAPMVRESSREALYPLSATFLTRDTGVACKLVERLVQAGASSSASDGSDISVFHRAVYAGKTEIVWTLLRVDPNARLMLNLLPPTGVNALVAAVGMNNRAMLAVLLAHGVKLVITREDYEQCAKVTARRSYLARADRWRNSTVMPVEASLARHNEMYTLLMDLGAESSLRCRNGYSCPWNDDNKLSLLECLQDGAAGVTDRIAKLDGESSTASSTSAPLTLADRTTPWLTEYARISELLRRAVETSSAETNSRTEHAEAQMLLQYLVEADAALTAAGATKTWNEIAPETDQEPVRVHKLRSLARPTEVFPPFTPQYERPHKDGQEVSPSSFAAYGELFEACWAGDNAKVTSLCLPKPGTKSAGSLGPLVIAVVILQEPYNYGTKGLSPLTVALLARKWDTAKLVLAIAAAQLEKTAEKVRRMNVVSLHEDDDSGDDDSDGDCGDNSDEDDALDLTDIAHRVSQVSSRTKPAELLTARFQWSDDGTLATRRNALTMLDKAIAERDLESFLNICSLYNDTEGATLPAVEAMENALQSDSPEILDELIRRCGCGLELTFLETQAGRAEDDASPRPASNIYLGLNFHGKKRKDLAQRADPDAPQANNGAHIPLLWLAARCDALECISFLKSPGASAAYRFYMDTNTSEHAMTMKRIVDLDSKLPSLLGFNANALNETPLFCALLKRPRYDGDDVNQLPTIKHLLKSFPEHSATYLHARVKWSGLTPLLAFGIITNGPPSVFDFFLDQGCDVQAVDHRGYNILHLACLNGSYNLLAHMLQKTPGDVRDIMLARTSRVRFNSPLMVAVKKRRVCIVELLLAVESRAASESVLIKDIDGFLPIHVAASGSSAKILAALVAKTPAAAFERENGIGATALEIALQADFVSRRGCMAASQPDNMDLYEERAKGHPVAVSEADIDVLRAAVARLTTGGTLRPDTPLSKRIAVYVESVAALAQATRPASDMLLPEVAVKDKGQVIDGSDPAATLLCIQRILAAAPAHRELVHLMDTQTSVLSALEKLKQKVTRNEYRRSSRGREDGEAEDTEAAERRKGVMNVWRVDCEHLGHEVI